MNAWPLADVLVPPVENLLDRRGLQMFAASMSKLTAFSTVIVGALAVAPWMVTLLGDDSMNSVGWWGALIVYPGAIAVLVLIAAVIRDVLSRRYWALVAPILVLLAVCIGFVIWLAVAFHSADFTIVD